MKALSLLLAFLFSTEAWAVQVSSPQAHIEIITDKVAHIIGEIDPNTAAKFGQEMLATAGLPGDRVIIINSPGGWVTMGQVMIDIMLAEKANGTRMICVAENDATSMAFDFLSYCDVRIASAGTRFLVHKVAIYIDQQTRPTAKNLRKLADEAEKTDEQYRRKNAKEMHLTLKEYDDKADAETSWSVQDLLRHKYLHGVATLVIDDQ